METKVRQRNLSLKDLREQLVKLDAYPKTLEDFRIKTLGGGTVTIISVTLIVVLFLLELHYYLTPYVHEELMVDISNGKNVTINFDIVFPHVSCLHLSLDATDISGDQHINIHHNVYKRRLDDKGKPIEDAEKDSTIVNKKSKALLLSNNTHEIEKSNTTTLDPNRCESCYGAENLLRKCCNTCNEVREAYNSRGWQPPNPSNIEQCKREGIKNNFKNTEGCHVYGIVEVNRIAGNFHISLGQSSEQHHIHVHDINLSDLLTVNTSHKINHLSFGPKLDKTVNQLDGTSFISEEGSGLATFQYYIKIIPTIYQNINKEEIQTNQFAVTRYKKDFGTTFDALSESRLPGIFFIYEFAPMLVKYSERERSFLHFITSLCGIVGGILTVAGIVDSFIYHSYKVLRAKIQIGKFS